jgi:hypothetical protein
VDGLDAGEFADLMLLVLYDGAGWPEFTYALSARGPNAC